MALKNRNSIARSAVSRIAVVRALHLGDMLCAVPALRALRAGHPDATITLIGLPWARELATRLPRYVDEFGEFPGFPGIPEREIDPARTIAFLAEMQARHFDLVVQLHGSGSHINEFAILFGATRVAAFHAMNDAVVEGGCFVPWPATGTEVERLLALPRALGCPEVGAQLELDVTDADHAALRALDVADRLEQGVVCVHPGARFASRRWSADRFAAIADALAARGFTIAITGTAAERDVTSAVRRAMHATAIDLTGRLTLGMLAALVARATLVVCNDTGMSHVAAAVGTRSVVVASGSDVARWAPHDTRRHRVLWHDTPCRPCMYEQCPTGHECANAIQIADVLRHADDILHAEPLHA